MGVKKILLWICCLILSAFSAEDSLLVQSSSSQESSSSEVLEKRIVLSVPLSRQSAYIGKGVSVGIAAGVFNPTEDCDCLGVWQGQLEYFYADWVSGGIDVRFFGGDLDSDANILYQRYRANVRFHFPFEKLDMFLSPVLGLETTDIEQFRNEWDNREQRWWMPGEKMNSDSLREKVDCEKMFSLDGFTVGAEFGVGWRFSKHVGLTGSALYEYNFAGAQLLTLTPGTAFNLGDAWTWASNNLLSSWISVEVGFQRYFNRGVSEWAISGYLGLQVGI